MSSGVPDLIQAVAMAPENPTNETVALAFARLPATTPGLFSGSNTDAQANTDNLGQLFTTHFHGIMDTLTAYKMGDLGVGQRGVASLIASVFGDHAGRISAALTGVSKSLIGTGTDQLSSDAQAALVNALGENTSQFLTQEQATSALKESFFTGLNKGDTALESLIGSIESNIADARKQGSTSGALQGG
jgi:hypothetical protein